MATIRIQNLYFSVAEVSGEWARPKVYEKGQKYSSNFAWFGIEYQNLDAFLENKVQPSKSKLSKYVNNKS